MDFAGQFQAVHSFHAKVGDQNVEIVFLELFQRLFSVAGADGTVPLHLQNLATQPCQDLVIVDKEDGPHATSFGPAPVPSQRAPGRAGTLRTFVSKETRKDAFLYQEALPGSFELSHLSPGLAANFAHGSNIKSRDVGGLDQLIEGGDVRGCDLPPYRQLLIQLAAQHLEHLVLWLGRSAIARLNDGAERV